MQKDIVANLLGVVQLKLEKMLHNSNQHRSNLSTSTSVRSLKIDRKIRQRCSNFRSDFFRQDPCNSLRENALRKCACHH